MSYQQKLLLGSLQIYDKDAIIFPFVGVLFHLEVKLVPPKWVPVVRNLRTPSSFLQDIKYSGDCENFLLSYNGNTEQH